jgi:hypothetical protein
VIRQSAAHTFAANRWNRLSPRLSGAIGALRLAAYAAPAMKLVGITDSRHYL